MTNGDAFDGAAHADALIENEQLKQRIANQKRTILAYRNETCEWQAVAESRGQTIDRMGTENAKLREVASDMLGVISDMQSAFDASVVRDGTEMDAEYFIDRLREVGRWEA